MHCKLQEAGIKALHLLCLLVLLFRNYFLFHIFISIDKKSNEIKFGEAKTAPTWNMNKCDIICRLREYPRCSVTFAYIRTCMVRGWLGSSAHTLTSGYCWQLCCVFTVRYQIRIFDLQFWLHSILEELQLIQYKHIHTRGWYTAISL